jgi:hypothetical protein
VLSEELTAEIAAELAEETVSVVLTAMLAAEAVSDYQATGLRRTSRRDSSGEPGFGPAS